MEPNLRAFLILFYNCNIILKDLTKMSYDRSNITSLTKKKIYSKTLTFKLEVFFFFELEFLMINVDICRLICKHHSLQRRPIWGKPCKECHLNRIFQIPYLVLFCGVVVSFYISQKTVPLLFLNNFFVSCLFLALYRSLLDNSFPRRCSEYLRVRLMILFL